MQISRGLFKFDHITAHYHFSYVHIFVEYWTWRQNTKLQVKFIKFNDWLYSLCIHFSSSSPHPHTHLILNTCAKNLFINFELHKVELVWLYLVSNINSSWMEKQIMNKFWTEKFLKIWMLPLNKYSTCLFEKLMSYSRFGMCQLFYGKRHSIYAASTRKLRYTLQQTEWCACFSISHPCECLNFATMKIPLFGFYSWFLFTFITFY